MYVYLDIESTGLDARTSQLRIVSIDGTAYDVWDEYQREEVQDILKGISGSTVVGHNLQFDLDFLAEHLGYTHKGEYYDTMIAYQLINAGRRQANGQRISASLDAVVKHLLGVELDKQFQKGAWDGNVDNEMLKYAAEDTRILKPLVKELNAGLRKSGLEKIFKLEMQLLPVLLQSKRKGVLVDSPAVQRLIKKEKEQAKRVAKTLPMITVKSDDAPIVHDSLFAATAVEKKIRLNARSSQQVAEYFKLPDATDDTLREYIRQTGDEEAQKIRDIRKHYKRASSVQKQILDRIRYDGRIHPTFFQTFTETGRLSSREPNLQNQDRSEAVRSLFIPAEGCRFVISDYSQLELRLAAYFSGDKNMLKVYREGEADLHTETQVRIFGDPRHMSKDEAKKARTLAKNINFGLVYGGGHGVLMRFAAKNDIYLDEEEAIEYRKAFRALYPQLVEWQKRLGGDEGYKEFVYTHLGRRRFITPGEGYCTRINNLVQGSAADGMKLAMVYLHRKHGILPLANIHDEVIIECDVKDAENILSTVRAVMVDSMYRATKQNPLDPTVPIAVEAEIAKSWAEKA